MQTKPSTLLADLKDGLGHGILFGLIYCTLYLAIGAPFAYGGPVFSSVVIWLGAQLFGLLFQLMRMPNLLGMLISGIVIKNVVPGLIDGLPREWSAGFRAAALCTIFLRSGLELDLKVFKRVGPAATRLLLIPGLTEAFVAGGAAIGIMGLTPFFGFTLGFILKAVGPAIVIQTMFDVQKAGLGVAKGIPSIIVAAASFDDLVALTGYSLFSNLAVNNQKGSFAFKMAHGVIDIAVGLAGGVIGAIFCSCTVVFNTRLKRFGAVFFTSMAILFLLYLFDFRTAGALAALVLGLIVNVFWEKGINVWGLPGYLSDGPGPLYGADVEHVVGAFWRIAAQPMLFGIIGTLINFRVLSAAFIPKALAVIVIGLAVRIPTTYMAMTGAGLTVKERIFVAMAWTPKATVQAALAAAPLDAILQSQGADSPDRYYGEAILTTSVFAILICAPIGVTLIHFFAPHLLEKADLVTTGRKGPASTGGDGTLGAQSGHWQRPPSVQGLVDIEPNGLSSDAASKGRSKTARAPSTDLVVARAGSGTGAQQPRAPSLHTTSQRSAGGDSPSRGGSPASSPLKHRGHATAFALGSEDLEGGRRSSGTLSHNVHNGRSDAPRRASMSESARRAGLGTHSQQPPPRAHSLPHSLSDAARRVSLISDEQVADVLRQALEQRTLERQDSTMGNYVVSLERLAEMIDEAPEDDHVSHEAAAQMRELVVSLRRKLVADSRYLMESEEGLKSARDFYALAQSVTTLPEVGWALEELPEYMRRSSNSSV